MKRGPISIPYEMYERSIEHLSRSPDYPLAQLRGHASILFENIFSCFSPGYHFSSVEDFLRHESALVPSISRMAFHSLCVEKSAYERIRDDESHRDVLELLVSDSTGRLSIHYSQPVRLVWGHELPPDTKHDTLFGARLGDDLIIYHSLYWSMGSIQVSEPWGIRNDKHHARLHVSKNTPPTLPLRHAG